jgi:hypothetical protein
MSDQNIITEAQLQNIIDQLSTASSSLNNHAAQDYSLVHQLWTKTSIVTLDSAGDVTGTNAVKIKLGSTYYLLPATTSSGGPAKLPLITLQPVETVSHANPGDPQPRVTFTVSASSATVPLMFTWQIYDIALAQFVDRGDGETGQGYETGGGHHTTWTVFHITSLAGSSAMELDSTSPGAGNYTCTRIRCKVSNAGGYTYSTPIGGVRFIVEDET